jgi:hypothetical protein
MQLVFIKKGGQLRKMRSEVFDKHKGAIIREGWRIASNEDIKNAGYEIQEEKKETKKVKVKPIEESEPE